MTKMDQIITLTPPPVYPFLASALKNAMQPRRFIITLDKSYCFLCWRGVESNLIDISKIEENEEPAINLYNIFRTAVDQETINTNSSSLICEDCRLYFKFATHFKILCESACTLKKGVKANEYLINNLRDVVRKSVEGIIEKSVQKSKHSPFVQSYEQGRLPTVIRLPQTAACAAKKPLPVQAVEVINPTAGDVAYVLHDDGADELSELRQALMNLSHEVDSINSGISDNYSSQEEDMLDEDENEEDDDSFQQAELEQMSACVENSINENLKEVDHQTLEGLSALPLNEETEGGLGTVTVLNESTGLFEIVPKSAMDVELTEDEILEIKANQLLMQVLFGYENQKCSYEENDAEADDFDMIFICHICTRRFVSAKSLAQHKCPRAQVEKMTVCPYCALVAETKSFVNHFDTCTMNPIQPDPLTCPYENCKRVVKHDRSLRNHISLYHTQVGPFLCDICEKKFTTKSKLIKHLQFVHENKRRFLCTECGKRFHTNWHLKMHKKSAYHSPHYACDYCSQKFMYKQLLETHMQSEHLTAVESYCIPAT